MAKTIYTNREGYAVQGHDPVAYFTDNAQTKGDPGISYDWNGATWLFATEANRDKFTAKPEAFAPAFGGHCALGRAMGVNVKGSAKRWRIEDGRLMLNKNILAAVMHRPFAGRIRKLANRR